MDTEIVEQAIRKAIRSGAVPARPNPLMSGNDADLFRAQTDVDIEPQALEDFVTDLMRDSEMARLDSAFATVATGGGHGARLASRARLLLARAMASGDVTGTVETFRSYIEKNAAPMDAVMAVAGIKAAPEMRLGPDIRLTPITSLSPSLQRGEALGQALPGHFVQPAIRRSVSSALITGFEYGPIFYWPNEGGIPSATAHQGVRSALQHLDEARSLLALLGISTAMTSFWVQPKDPLMWAGANVGWLSSTNFFPGQDVEVDVTAAEELASAYFGMNLEQRRKALHIPLDRLERAVRKGADLTDRSIDLGIALEALLLHEHDGRDSGELKFRLSLRGAWLGGNDATERAEIQRTLKHAYDLRSHAVHRGRVDPSPKNHDTIERGISICQRLIRRAIDEGGDVEWGTLVLGGPARKA